MEIKDFKLKIENIPNANDLHLGYCALFKLYFRVPIKVNHTLLLIAFTLFLPIFVSASVVITEVMYDMDGSDSGREWVEVCNTSSDSVSLTGWKLFENGTNHGLTMSAGSEMLLSGSFAVLADNPEKFLIDWPAFSGTLFDSAFSLSNTGETIEIRNPELATVNSLTYSSELGAKGDGNSIHVVSGAQSIATPTPGSGVCTILESSPVLESDEPSESSTTTTTAPVSSSGYVPTPSIRVNAGKDIVVVSGADSVFEAETFGIKGESMDAERYVWSYGDGARGEGKKVRHAYLHPGEYIVFVDVVSGEYSTSDRVNVKVIPADILVSSVSQGVEGYIEIQNNTAHELDLSLWSLFASGKTFYIPENTFLKSRMAIKLSAEVTGLSPLSSSDVVFMYPNGRIVNAKHKSEARSTKSETLTKFPSVPDDSASNSEMSDEVENNDVYTTPTVQNDENLVKSGDIAYGDDNENLMASPSKASGLDMKWLASLLAVMAVGAYGAWILQRSDADAVNDDGVNIEKDAKEYEIIE